MNSDNGKLNYLKLLKKNIKQNIAQKGIKSITRNGDKELDLLVKKIIKQPIQSEQDVSDLGERLAAEIVEIFQQKETTELDKSVIRQLPYFSTPPEKHSPSSSKVKSVSKSSVEMTTLTLRQETVPIPSPTETSTGDTEPEISDTPTPELESETEAIIALDEPISSDRDENPAPEPETVSSEESNESQPEELIPS
ncbi:hypothetical protein PCC7424_3989 [Gloeothece citriformis PCC 7424]|uniref:Uncharacterized protein n=1 Tax=Gloeothece citriformis (strain PCC 7424) TaxID=65393 RepID=B7KKZ1_GLOC7|nr:hypothetical protein [Gloeothece citriformis]ACK72363.1 hypothetical protein PCC7424_3989 [Gloeothece citriformis PCC 7424]